MDCECRRPGSNTAVAMRPNICNDTKVDERPSVEDVRAGGSEDIGSSGQEADNGYSYHRSLDKRALSYC